MSGVTGSGRMKFVTSKIDGYSFRQFGQACLLSALLLGCLCLCSPHAVTAQYRFDSWTTDNGLPQGSINSILQTRDGYIWLATFGGLARFDGLRFQVFNTSESTPKKFLVR
jgi:ligand-binding sensor domain-containing protein